jgi:hypothetical protein
MKQPSVDRRHRRGERSARAAVGLRKWVLQQSLSGKNRLIGRLPRAGDDRGDVPGWVLVTLMTAGLVLTLWAVAGPRLEEVFNDAMDRVVGGP